MAAVEAVFMKGGNLHKLCKITLTDGRDFTVEPYAIYTSGRKRRCYLWYQISSSDPGEERGWRSPEAASVATAKLLEDPFDTRRDYDPFDRVEMPVVHYSIPTHDGRQRWMDARKDFDKQTLTNREAL